MTAADDKLTQHQKVYLAVLVSPNTGSLLFMHHNQP